MSIDEAVIRVILQWVEERFRMLIMYQPMIVLSKYIKDPIAAANTFITTFFGVIVTLLGVLVVFVTKDIDRIFTLFWCYASLVALCMLLIGVRTVYEGRKNSNKKK